MQNVEVNKENFDVVDSYEKILFYSRLSQDYRGNMLEKAEKFDLIHTYTNTEIPVMESNRSFKIHQAWNNNEDFFLIYSVNLLPGDEKPKDLPYMTYGDILLHNEKNQKVRIVVDPYETDPNNGLSSTSKTGFLYKNRFYRSIWIDGNGSFHEDIMNWKVPEEKEGDAIQQRLELVDKVSFTNLKMINKDFKMTHLDPIQLDMSLTTNQPLEVYELNETLELMDKTVLKLKRLELRLDNTRLYVDIGDNPEGIRQITYEINGNPISTQLEQEMEETFIYVDSDISLPERVDFHFTEVSVATDQELTYKLDGKTLKEYKNQLTKHDVPPLFELNKEIGKINETDLLTALSIDVRKTHDHIKAVSVNFGIGVDSPENRNYWFNDYDQFADLLDEGHYVSNNPFVEVTDTEGKRIRLSNVIGHHTGTRYTVNMMFEKELFLQKDELNFRFFNFSMSKPIDRKLIDVPLVKK